MAGADVMEPHSSGVYSRANGEQAGLVKSHTMDEATLPSQTRNTLGHHQPHSRHSSSSRAGHSNNHHVHHHHHPNGTSRGQNTPKKGGRMRHKTNSLSKSLTRAILHHKESSTNQDISDPKTYEATVLPPISGPQNGASGLKGDQLSPRHFAYSNGLSSSTPNPQALSRLAMRGASSPEGIMKHPNNLRPETIFEGPPKTPPITNQSLVNAASSAHQAGNSRAATNININNNGNNPHISASPEPVKTLETSRSSPVNGADKAKVKFEKKILKIQTENESIHLPASPGGNKPVSPGANKPAVPGEATNPLSQNKDKIVKPQSRRSSTQSVPKIAPFEEPFSIRRKIEQFRKWHEEQYTDKLRHLKLGGELKHHQGATPPAPSIDFAKILEENIIQNRSLESDASDSNRNQCKNGHEQKERGDPVVTSSGKRKGRPDSGATWKTWRDVNQSDAYTDVKKYIKDNDLMDKEREEWIKLWITDVRTAMEQMGEEMASQ